MYLVQFIRGFCMALADSVPGVSGGTVAFLLGFYDQFIDSIDDLITGSREKKKAALFFLIKLGTGWVCGMILAILILASVFDAHIYAISSLFIGFIIFAIPIIFREEKNCLAAKKSAIPFVLIGVAIVTAITYFNPSSGGEGVSLEHLTPGLALFVFPCRNDCHLCDGAAGNFGLDASFNHGTVSAGGDCHQRYSSSEFCCISDGVYFRMRRSRRYFWCGKADPQGVRSFPGTDDLSDHRSDVRINLRGCHGTDHVGGTAAGNDAS